MCFFKNLKLQKQLKSQKNIIREIINSLDDNTLNRIKRKSETYITYTIDNKQLNKKQDVKTRQKEYLELLELINSQLVMNQFELCTKAQTPTSDNNNAKSTFDEAESTPVKESKKKEK